MAAAIPPSGASQPTQPAAGGAPNTPPPGSRGSFDGTNFSGTLGPAQDKGADSGGKLGDADVNKILTALLEKLSEMAAGKGGKGSGGGDSGGGGAPVGGGGSPKDALSDLLGNEGELRKMLEKLGFKPDEIDKFMKAVGNGEVNADGKVGGDGEQANAAPAESADIL